MRQTNRNPVKLKKIARYFNDLEPHKHLNDRRSSRGRRRLIPFRALTSSLLLGMTCACVSMPAVEKLTARLHPRVRRISGIRRRISDSKLRMTCRQLRSEESRVLIHRQVKAAHRRGQLRSRFPISVVSIDGKGVGKLEDWGHPDVQEVHPSTGWPYGLCRELRATLVSAAAAVCIDQMPIPGKTNEIGCFPDYLWQLWGIYGRTSLIDALMVDGGLASRAVVQFIDEQMQKGYIARVTEMQGEIHLEASMWLSRQAPEAEEWRLEKGHYWRYRFYRKEYDGSPLHGWVHLRQLLRITREKYAVVYDEQGHKHVGECLGAGIRYWGTNLPFNTLTAKQCLALLRSHWRCENENHWSSDVLFKEDARRTPWTTEAETLYSLANLRMVALNLLAMLRAEARRGGQRGGQPWADIAERVKDLLKYGEVHEDWRCYADVAVS